MANIKEIQDRMRSIQDTLKITNAMYMISTTIMVVIEDAVSVVLGAFVMNLAWKAILFSYSGWFAFVIQPAGYVKMFAFVLIGYLFVMILDFMRIKRIPMDQALKNVE